MPRLVVKVSKSHYDKLDSVVETLAGIGFIPLTILRQIGVIIGDYRGGSINKLERVPGVSVVVEDQREFRPSDTKSENARVRAGSWSLKSPRRSSVGDSAKKKLREIIDACTRFDG